MARPITVTKERILSAALDLVRSSGPSALTARGLCETLGCGANAIFSSFGSIQGVRDAVRKEARALYRRRVGAGFSLNPSFKGFGMALLWFAMDEPQLYSLVMEADTPAESFENYADTYVGFKQESIAAITTSFNLRGHEAKCSIIKWYWSRLDWRRPVHGADAPSASLKSPKSLGRMSGLS